MKFFCLLGLLLAVTQLVVCNYDWIKNREAEMLTHDSIGSVLLKPSLTKIITFLRPDSFECQGMTLVLEDYARELKGDGVENVQFYEVNCVNDQALCGQMGVTDVPFIFVFNPEGMAELEIPG